MKKILVILLGALFVFSFAASAFAIHAEIPAETTAVVAKAGTQITLGGQIRTRGWFENNKTDLQDGGNDDHQAFLETRVDLNVHAQISPNTEAMIWIRDTKVTGDDDQTWGVNGAFADRGGNYRNGGQVLGTDETNLAIIEAWVQHKFTSIPVGFKVGHMPLALGNGLFYSHTKNGEDGLVIFASPVAGLETAFVYAKFAEGNTSFNDDADVYVLLANYNMSKDVNISGDVTYLDDQATADGLHFWNFGLRGKAGVAGVSLRGDVEVQTGTADSALPNGDDQDFSGWAGLVGVDFNLAPVKLTLEAAYGSGDDDANDDDMEEFITVLDNTPHYSFIYEYRTVSASITGQGLTGLANTFYVKAGAAADLTSNISAKLDVYYLMANETDSFVFDEDEIGWEIDPTVTFKLSKNLKYWVDGGYLFAGDFFKNVTGGADPDDAYTIRNGIQLNF